MTYDLVSLCHVLSSVLAMPVATPQDLKQKPDAVVLPDDRLHLENGVYSSQGEGQRRASSSARSWRLGLRGPDQRAGLLPGNVLHDVINGRFKLYITKSYFSSINYIHIDYFFYSNLTISIEG